jgi:orotidine-5'-phosphate decarboxylase
MKPRIFIALDVNTIEEAQKYIELLYPLNKRFKIGLELITAAGLPQVMSMLKAYPEIEIFMDLKFHDIPNTVVKSIEAILQYPSIKYLTIHGSNNEDTLNRVCGLCKNKIKVLAVTVLTSIDNKECIEIYNNSIIDTVNQLVVRAVAHGIIGIVCSVEEVANIKSLYPKLEVMCPGIAIVDNNQDQMRSVNITDPKLKLVDNIVIGRAIIQSLDPFNTLITTLDTISSL